MTTIIFYETREERAQAISNQEALGETLLHDDFGVGPRGENQLTFEVQVERAPSARILRRRALSTILKEDDTDNAMTLVEVKELLRLERGL